MEPSFVHHPAWQLTWQLIMISGLKISHAKRRNGRRTFSPNDTNNSLKHGEYGQRRCVT